MSLVQEYTHSITVGDDTWEFTIVKRDEVFTVKDIKSTGIISGNSLQVSLSPNTIAYRSIPGAYVEQGILVPEVVLISILACIDALSFGTSDINELISQFSSAYFYTTG